MQIGLHFPCAGRRPQNRKVRLAGSVAAALLALGCPQLLDDDFEKASDRSAEGAGASGGNSASTGSGFGGSLNIGLATASSTGGATGEAGASPDGSGGGGTETTTMTSTTSGDGTGGGGPTTVKGPPPALLVYATAGGDVLARAWEETAFGDPVVWNTPGETVAFVEARLHPNRQSGVVAYQTDGGDQCSLWVHLHEGLESQAPKQIPIGTSDKCLTTRSFDVAYERLSGTGLVVYAADDMTLEYRTIVDQELSEAIEIDRGTAASEIQWVRLSPDPKSDKIALGHTGSTSQSNSLVALLWDGDSWGSSEQIAGSGAVLGSQSFDLAFDEELLSVRADDSDDGVDYAWMQDGAWSNEELLGGAPGWDVTFLELMSTPEGIAGIAIDTLGDTGRLGAFFHDGQSFVEATQLDLTLPPTTELEPPAMKGDLGLLGDSVVAVYPTDYVGGSAIGWALRAAGSSWTLMEGDEPDLEQMSRGAVPWSLRLAPLPGPDAGLILTFSEEQGLYFTYLTNLETGWATPVLVDAEVTGDEYTPYDVSSID